MKADFSSDHGDKSLWQKGWFRAALGFIISALFLYLAFRKVDFGVVKNAIIETSIPWLLVSVGVGYINIYLRALRWKFILRHIKKIPIIKTFSFLMIGYTINNILPFRVGELGRSIMLAKSEEISKSAVVASVVVERWFDIVGLMVFFPVLLAALVLPNQTKLYMLLSSISIILSIIIVYVIVIKRELSFKIVNRLVSLLPKIVQERVLGLANSFFDGLNVLKSKRRIALLVIFSVGIWFVTMFIAVFRFKAFLFDLPFHAAIATVTGVNIAAGIPSSPSQIGVAHLAYQKVLWLFGIDNATALAFGIVSHALSFLAVVIPGSIFILLHFLRSKKEKQSDTV